MKIALTAAALGLLATPALAADLAVGSPPPVAAPMALYNWTGAYVGINAGGGFGGNVDITSVVPFVEGRISDGGFLAGGTLGYNYQFGRFVAGLEGDFDWSNIGVRSTPVVPGGNVTIEANWLATVRARLGYTPWDTGLVYVTGGGAFGDIHSNVGPAVGPYPIGSKTHTGWTVGAGFEMAIGHTNWTVKGEYLYADLGGETYSTAFPPLTARVKMDAHIVRVGLNYRFW